MAKWSIITKRADFAALGEKLGISPVLVRIMRNRDLMTEEEMRSYLWGTLPSGQPAGDDLGILTGRDPHCMKDLVKAAKLLKGWALKGKKIRIIGDYDIDGVCASYILLRGLQQIGADVDAAIPHRVTDGYGLNEHLVRDAANDGREVLVTCDNGIAASKQIDLAYELGLKVIVTDHHEVPFEEDPEGEHIDILPNADAVVDPKRMDEEYPFPGICGAVVAWKLIAILLEECADRCSMEQSATLLDELSEEAALATIGDVMELCDENRMIVRRGLERLPESNNKGLRALISCLDLEGKPINCGHVGFRIGPCLNATGRLDSAKRALDLLCCKDSREAKQIATELVEMNETRKSMTQEGVDQAVEQIEKLRETEGAIPPVLVIYLPECHESIAGIVAGRIREKYVHPVFVLTGSEDGIKGSGRSIPEYHMFRALSACSDLLTKFGGHSMAAGLSMDPAKLDEFRTRINRNASLPEDAFEEKVKIDMELPVSYVTEELIEQLSLLEPFGNGNSRPIFAERGVLLLGGRIMGNERNVGKYRIRNQRGAETEITLFGDQEPFLDFLKSSYGEDALDGLISGNLTREIRFHMTYYPEINEFRGRRSIQFRMTAYCV